MFPEAAEYWILKTGADGDTDTLIGEDFGDVQEGGVFELHKSEDDIAENIFEARSPGVGVEFFENANNACGDEFALSGEVLGVHGAELKRIEAEGVLKIGRIEVNDVVHPVGRNKIKDCIGELAVGVDDAETLLVAHVGDDHVLKKR